MKTAKEWFELARGAKGKRDKRAFFPKNVITMSWTFENKIRMEYEDGLTEDYSQNEEIE